MARTSSVRALKRTALLVVLLSSLVPFCSARTFLQATPTIAGGAANSGVVVATNAAGAATTAAAEADAASTTAAAAQADVARGVSAAASDPVAGARTSPAAAAATPFVDPVLSASPNATTDDIFLCADQSAFGELPDLRIEVRLDSRKPRVATDVTLVTQLSFERLYMLEGQCRSWTGVISAAVHIPLVRGSAVVARSGGSGGGGARAEPTRVPLEEVISRVRAFHAEAEAGGLCKLDVQLVSQEFASAWLAGLYPVNSMRNRALAAARTDVALLLDVDFWPSAELSELMLHPGKYASLVAATRAGNAIVLPAFETSAGGERGVAAARAAVAEGKPAAVARSAAGALKAFHTDRYAAGHRATDYARWAAAERPYRVAYEEGYEPYVLIARARVPWYDERFVGYRKNKVVHLLHVAAMGTQFVVHPRAFVVHAPHPRAATWKVTHKTGLWDALAAMYTDVKTRLAAGTYVPDARYSCGAHAAGPAFGLEGLGAA